MKQQVLSILFTVVLGVLLLFEGFSGERFDRLVPAMQPSQSSSASVQSQPAAQVYFRVLSWISQVLPAKASEARPSDADRVARRVKADSQQGHMCAIGHTPAFAVTAVQP